MTPQEIKDKIENLDYWLVNNQNSPEYIEVLQDKNNLLNELKEAQNVRPN